MRSEQPQIAGAADGRGGRAGDRIFILVGVSLCEELGEFFVSEAGHRRIKTRLLKSRQLTG